MTRISQHFFTLLLCCLLTLSGVVLAASPAEKSATSSQKVTVDQLIGSWVLEGTAHKQGGEINAQNQSWKFNPDGTLTSVIEDHRAADTFSLTVKYKLENGTILVQRVGRTSRWNRFRVLEISKNAMTLKGGIEGYMYFKRKK